MNPFLKGICFILQQTQGSAVDIIGQVLYISQSARIDKLALRGVYVNNEEICLGSMDDKSIEEKQVEVTPSSYSINTATIIPSFISQQEYSSISPPLMETITIKPSEIGHSNTINDFTLDIMSTNNAITWKCGQYIASDNNLAIHRGEVPWLITVFGKFGGTIKFLCSGILISNQYALTTAKCFENDNEKIPIKTVSI